MEFKQGNRIPSKEELIETPGYHEIEQKLCIGCERKPAMWINEKHLFCKKELS